MHCQFEGAKVLPSSQAATVVPLLGCSTADSPAMVSQHLHAVHADNGSPVNGAKVQQDMLLAPLGGDGEVALVVHARVARVVPEYTCRQVQMVSKVFSDCQHPW